MARTTIIVADVVQVTAMAMLLDIEGEDHWIPKSVIVAPEEFDKGDVSVEITVETWFLEKEGIEI